MPTEKLETNSATDEEIEHQLLAEKATRILTEEVPEITSQPVDGTELPADTTFPIENGRG